MLQRQATKPGPSRQPGVSRDTQLVAAPVLERERWPEREHGIGNQAAARRLQGRAAERGSAAAGAPTQTTNATVASSQVAPAMLSRISRAPLMLQRRCAACEAEEETQVQPRLQIGPAGDRSQVAPAMLSRISRAPLMLQRRCAACEAEEEARVQPRLEVGPAGDRYEQEADNIAGHVMAMRAGDVSPAGPALQRACSACSSSKDELRLRRMEAAVEEEDEHKGQARSLDAGGGGQTIAASEQQLTNGGSALSESSRNFFESRMGRDLSGVRVHIGGEAGALNDSIAARAFTYKSHIWLGNGERELPSFTMAHELAHVMQQTAPGPVGPGAAHPPASGFAGARVQRVPCDPESENLFYAPKSRSTEEGAEQGYIKLLTKKTGVLGEIPIPNAIKGDKATKAAYGCEALGTFGSADLVKTDNGRFPGFAFRIIAGSTNPRPWFSLKPSDMLCNLSPGKRLEPMVMQFFGRYATSYFNGATRSAKLLDDTAPSWVGWEFRNDGIAPTSIEIGEVKFGGTEAAQKGARRQISHYLEGIKFAQRGYESIRQQIDRRDNELDGKLKLPSLKEWKLSTDELKSITGVPDNWTPLSEDLQLIVAKWVPKSTIVKEGERELEPRRCDGTGEYIGKWYGGHISPLPVWLYAWYPNAAPPLNSNGSAQFTDYRSTAKRLLGEATASPAHDAKPPPRRMPLASSPQASAIQRKPKSGKPFPKADPFQDKYAEWKATREKLSKDFEAFEKTKQFGKDTASLAFNRALTNTKKITGKSPNSLDPDTSAATKEAEKALRDLEIIAGPAGFVLGELRYRLGTFFLSIMGAYNTIKEKLTALFTKKSDSSGGNLTTRAIRAFMKGLGLIASFLLPRVTDALIDCVKNGFRSTLEGWIADTPLADIKAKFDSYLDEARKIKDDVFKSVDDIFGPVIKYYDEFKGIVQDAASIVDLAKKAFDAARVAACLAGGLESAGISCIVAAADKLLGLIGLSPSERLMGWLIESCPAQKIFAEAMLAIGAVRDFPKTIAKKIVEFVRPALPTQIQSLLCDPATMDKLEAEMPEIGDVTCGVGGSDKGGVERSDAPSDLDRSKVDRKPTEEEKKKFGKPATPPSSAPPPVQTPAAPPPAPGTAPPPATTTTAPPPTATAQPGKGGVPAWAEKWLNAHESEVTVNRYVISFEDPLAKKEFLTKVRAARGGKVTTMEFVYGRSRGRVFIGKVTVEARLAGTTISFDIPDGQTFYTRAGAVTGGKEIDSFR
jgi:hypothetical protein